jgi:hypothetical protein
MEEGKEMPRVGQKERKNRTAMAEKVRESTVATELNEEDYGNFAGKQIGIEEEREGEKVEIKRDEQKKG